MQKINPSACAYTFAILDIALHSLFRVWIVLSPSSYEWAMNLFIAGLELEVTIFDLGVWHILIGTILEAAAFWIFGWLAASLYNALLARAQ